MTARVALNLAAPRAAVAPPAYDWPAFDLLDVCAGAGGASLGAAAAGFAPLGVELDPDAVATHRAHAGACVLADIRRWRVPAGLRVRVCHGSTPCQSWSAAGRRGGFRDPRGELYLEWLRLAREAGAAAVTLENVAGLVTWRRPGDGRRAIDVVADAAEDAGFRHVAWRVLCAADYGVAQLRHRVVLVGFRDEPAAARFAWPAPTHGDPARAGSPLAPWVTVRRALGLGPDAAYAAAAGSRAAGFQGVRCLDVDAPGFTVGTARNADLLARLDRPATALSTREQCSALAFGSHGAATRPRRAGDVLNPALAAHAAVAAGRLGSLDHPGPTILAGTKGPGGGGVDERASRRPLAVLAREVARAAALDEPARTVSTGGGAGRSAGGVEVFANAEYRARLAAALATAGLADRPGTTVDGRPALSAAGHHASNKAGAVRLTLAQCAALQDFPADVAFVGNVTSQHRQCGNAFPPRFAAAVFRAVRAALGDDAAAAGDAGP